MKEKDIINIIYTIRVAISTKIQCYHFFLILKSIFPTAIAYCNSEHIITKINDSFYDINGKVRKLKNYLPLNKDYGIKFAKNYYECRDDYNEEQIKKAMEEGRFSYYRYMELPTWNNSL